MSGPDLNLTSHLATATVTALLSLPAGGRRGDRVDFRWFDEGWRWGAGGGPGGKAVI